MPPGVYPVTLAEALSRFGHGSVQRRLVANRLARVHCLATSTNALARLVVFGSFVTAKPDPRDIDLVLVMEDAFDVNSVSDEVAVIFRHAEADDRLGASVFWTTRTGAYGGEQAMVEYWQARRKGGLRGILGNSPGGIMIADDRQLAATLERIDWFQRQVVQLRQSVPNAANYRAAAGGFVAEIDRMQRQVREYLSLHPSELVAA